MADHARLLDKIAKLDRLASDRNPNVHEREVARRKANELRKQLNRTNVFDTKRCRNHNEMLRRQANSAQRGFKEDKDQLIIRLKAAIPKLKPSGKLFATELCMEYATTGRLAKASDWNLVRLLIEEGEL